ncbi:hypothetical protein [Fictibacillus barbaricus]|uniref:Uncharacterized protein n=1 Tax=Fictibacillus barbaricus TaxID=182136 RepID=A0ABU1TWI1_9BACL|nr:hypothetical protein [Fictibacillus barbaricus]MDR7071576.1 hypothetical protein [Fictibacillus barbaricus]
MFKSKKFIISLAVFCLIILLIVQKRDVIFQQGNPIPYALAISKMIVQDKGIVEVWKDEQYLVKRGKMEPFIKKMVKEGWEYAGRDKIGNALEFKKGNEMRRFGYQYYTRYYMVIFG